MRAGGQAAAGVHGNGVVEIAGALQDDTVKFRNFNVSSGNWEFCREAASTI